MHEAISEARLNPIAQMDTGILEGLQHLDHLNESGDHDGFFHKVMTSVWPTLSSVTEKPTTEALDKMCGKFHVMSTDSNFIEEINKFICEQVSGFEPGKSLFLTQCFLEGITKTILKKTVEESENIFEMPSKDACQNTKFSPQEEQALRYTAGYICHSLLNQLSKRKNNKAADTFRETVSKWNETNINISTTNFLSYTRKLVEYANRGGLFTINDNVYIFFRRMEIVIKPLLQEQNFPMKSNLKDHLETELLESRIVQLGFETICELDTDLRNMLLKMIIKRWIKLRLHAFAQACIFIRKIKSDNLAKKGEKGLRKQLKSN